MEAKLKIGLIILMAIIGVALLWIVSNQEKPTLTNGKKVVFGTPCNDYADIWTDAPQDKKHAECNRILKLNTADLKHEGFESNDCKVIKVEGRHCTGGMLGTHLVCTYACEK